MNYKRAILFGVMLWAFIFVIFSVVMFMPWFSTRPLAQHATLWILFIPLVLALVKWYSFGKKITAVEGLKLGLVFLVVGTILDMIITIPLFVKSFGKYYSDWKIYVGYAEVLALCAYAGFEFDNPVNKPASNGILDKR